MFVDISLGTAGSVLWGKYARFIVVENYTADHSGCEKFAGTTNNGMSQKHVEGTGSRLCLNLCWDLGAAKSHHRRITAVYWVRGVDSMPGRIHGSTTIFRFERSGMWPLTCGYIAVRHWVRRSAPSAPLAPRSAHHPRHCIILGRFIYLPQ